MWTIVVPGFNPGTTFHLVIGPRELTKHRPLVRSPTNGVIVHVDVKVEVNKYEM